MPEIKEKWAVFTLGASCDYCWGMGLPLSRCLREVAEDAFWQWDGPLTSESANNQLKYLLAETYGEDEPLCLEPFVLTLPAKGKWQFLGYAFKFEADEASFIATPAKYLGVIRAWLLATNENRHSWDVELCLIPATN